MKWKVIQERWTTVKRQVTVHVEADDEEEAESAAFEVVTGSREADLIEESEDFDEEYEWHSVLTEVLRP